MWGKIRRMNFLRLKIAGKIIAMNGVFLVLLSCSLLYVTVQVRRANVVVRQQQQSLSRLATVTEVTTQFTKMQYWLTDLSVTWLNESEEEATNTFERLSAALTTCSRSSRGIMSESRIIGPSFALPFLPPRNTVALNPARKLCT